MHKMRGRCAAKSLETLRIIAECGFRNAELKDERTEMSYVPPAIFGNPVFHTSQFEFETGTCAVASDTLMYRNHGLFRTSVPHRHRLDAPVRKIW